ncbi:MAG: hypothetical protein J6S67_07435 [Methanobrevibacter sp.]|nr:hypothetical protein [Methanobrevibacter sp.]
MPYIKYRLILEKYLMSDDESEDEHRVLHKYPPLGVSAVFTKDSRADNYKHRQMLREDMYRKMDDLCVSSEEYEPMANEEKAGATACAKWVKFDYTHDGRPAYYCSNCHAPLEHDVYRTYEFQYCYSCGAEMCNPFPCEPLEIKGEKKHSCS